MVITEARRNSGFFVSEVYILLPKKWKQAAEL